MLLGLKRAVDGVKDIGSNHAFVWRYCGIARVQITLSTSCFITALSLYGMFDRAPLLGTALLISLRLRPRRIQQMAHRLECSTF